MVTGLLDFFIFGATIRKPWCKFTAGIGSSDRKLKPLPPDPARHQDSARQYYLLSEDDF